VSPVKVSAWTVTGDSAPEGGVQIKAQTEGYVNITWGCQTRVFSGEDLSTFLERVEYIAMVEDVWLKDKDTQGNVFAISIIDGQAFADQGQANGSEGSVPWEDLKEALGLAAEQQSIKPEVAAE
jgi:hypothetical protein